MFYLESVVQTESIPNPGRKHNVELQYFGLNLLTISFLGTFVFNFVQLYGYGRQAHLIWKTRSAKSVGYYWFLYLMGMYFVSGVYGLSQSSLALIINGFLNGLFIIPILIGVLYFGEMNKLKKIAIAGVLSLVGFSVFTPYKDFTLLAVSIGSIAFSLNQPWEIWKNKDSGAVEIQLIAIFTINTCFWIMYGFSIDDWVIKLVSPGYLVVLAAVIVLWLIYPSSVGNRGGLKRKF